MTSNPEPNLTPENRKTADLTDLDAQISIRADFPPGSSLRVTIEKVKLGEKDTSSQARPILSRDSSLESEKGEPAGQVRLPRLHILVQINEFLLKTNLTWAGVLFGLALLVYIITRLVGLVKFPIYFFTDEAVQTVLASDLVRDGLRGYDRAFLPTYFLNVYQYNLGVSVYLQVLPQLIFGKVEWVTRAVPALVSLLAAAGAGLMMKSITGKSTYAWLAALILSITPAWFLHSRTAFETSLAVSFYAGFLVCYLKYRQGAVRWLLGSVIFGGLAFYSYSPAQMVVGVTALILFFSDLSYHWRQRKALLPGFVLALVFAVPYIRFQITHPDEAVRHLSVLNSYWIQEIPTVQKLLRFGQEYLKGFNPFYWYISNGVDLPRHQMLGYGHMLLWTFPLTLLGLGTAVYRFRQPEYRVLLAAFLAAPAGTALVALGITRALFVVLPAAVLCALGASILMEWLIRYFRLSRLVLALPVFFILVGFNFWMLRDSLVNGPLWFRDYGLGGMQYGASQIFDEINNYVEKSPQTKIILSSAWANGTDILARFFSPEPLKYEIGSIEGYFNEHKPLDQKTLFVIIPEEYERMLQTGKFTDINIEKTIPYPDGRAGFLFIRLRYVDNIDIILAAEKEARKVLQKAEIDVNGLIAHVTYSYLDMGVIEQIFDGNLESLVRTMEANPMKVNIDFASAQTIKGVKIKIGGTATRATLEAVLANENWTLSFSQDAAASPNPRSLDFDLGGEYKVSQVRLQVRSVNDDEPAHVHLWEVTIR
jgi:4-amino-4-deoxy-L-arabinose transferase-like glycosyltransferase